MSKGGIEHAFVASLRKAGVHVVQPIRFEVRGRRTRRPIDGIRRDSPERRFACTSSADGDIVSNACASVIGSDVGCGLAASSPLASTITAMVAGTGRPVVFLDVDGTLIPIGGPPIDGDPTVAGDDAAPSGNPLLARLTHDHGARLLALGVELVWATSWMDDANNEVSPRLGLPALPVVIWPDDDGPFDRRVHWKTPHVVAWANGRPFVWVDDEVTDADQTWVAAHHPGPVLLHRVNPSTGMTDTDFEAIRRWLRSQ